MVEINLSILVIIINVSRLKFNLKIKISRFSFLKFYFMFFIREIFKI